MLFGVMANWCSQYLVQTIRFYTRYSSWTSVISDEDLELRLGPKGIIFLNYCSNGLLFSALVSLQPLSMSVRACAVTMCGGKSVNIY